MEPALPDGVIAQVLRAAEAPGALVAVVRGLGLVTVIVVHPAHVDGEPERRSPVLLAEGALVGRRGGRGGVDVRGGVRGGDVVAGGVVVPRDHAEATHAESKSRYERFWKMLKGVGRLFGV